MSQVLKARRLSVLFVGCVLLLSLLPTAASATRSAAGDPDLAAMSLAAADFPAGAKVVRQRSVKPVKPAIAAYSREFATGMRLGSTRLLGFESDVSLYPSAEVAAKDVRDFRNVLRSRAGREGFAEVLAAGVGKGANVKLKRVAVSVPISLGAGQSSFHTVATFVFENKRSFDLHFAIVQTDRVVAMLIFTPVVGTKVKRAELLALGRLQGARFQQELTIGNVAAPALSGTASPTQTLTASNGEWDGAPSAYTYQWSRCDATATTCTDIAGATAATYTVLPQDVGYVLRTTVTAKNTVTSSSAVTPVSAPVA